MSRTAPRLFVPLDARFFDDDRIIRAGEKAAYLYLAILCEVKADGSDGMITRRKISRLNIEGWARRVERLVEAGLIVEIDTDDLDEITYLIPKWSRWNLLSYQVEARRKSAQEAAKIRWSRKKPDADSNADRIRIAMQRQSNDRENKPIALGSLVDNLLDAMADE